MKEKDRPLLPYFLLWLVLPFMVAHSFYGIFREWEEKFFIYLVQYFRHYFICIATVKLLQSSCLIQTILHVNYQTTIIEMPSLIRKGKNTCENCGTQTTKNNIVRHKKSCSAGTLYCTHCPNFSTKSQNDPNYHIAMKHSAPKPDVTFIVNFAFKSFQDFTLYVNINTQHGMQFESGTKDADVEHIVGDVEDHRLREELRSCQHFLVESELQNPDTKYSITVWKLLTKQS